MNPGFPVRPSIAEPKVSGFARPCEGRPFLQIPHFMFLYGTNYAAPLVHMRSGASKMCPSRSLMQSFFGPNPSTPEKASPHNPQTSHNTVQGTSMGLCQNQQFLSVLDGSPKHIYHLSRLFQFCSKRRLQTQVKHMKYHHLPSGHQLALAPVPRREANHRRASSLEAPRRKKPF